MTVKREAGRWFAIFACEVEEPPLPFSANTVGVDVGLTHFATLSDGTEIHNPRYYQNGQTALRSRAKARSAAPGCGVRVLRRLLFNQPTIIHMSFVEPDAVAEIARPVH